MDLERHEIETVAPDVARLRLAFANVFFVGAPASRWALVDAGLSLGAAQILEVAAERYGRESRPEAIVLTHGHFDHVGALEPLLGVWDVPVFAHPLELPYLTGHADYPPPDPTVGQGLMARLSPLFPEKGIDLGRCHLTHGWLAPVFRLYNTTRQTCNNSVRCDSHDPFSHC